MAKGYGKEVIIPDNPISRLLFSSTRLAVIWLIVRVYVGWAWLTAGWGKVRSPAWTGEDAGAAVTGYINGALGRVEDGNVTGWYATFLENVALPNATVFGYMVAWGELLVGLALILGVLTGIAAFFGSFMNVSFLLAGTISTNPVLFILATWLVLSWKVAGWYGLDRWLLPYFGTPWKEVRVEDKNASAEVTVDKTES